MIVSEKKCQSKGTISPVFESNPDLAYSFNAFNVVGSGLKSFSVKIKSVTDSVVFNNNVRVNKPFADVSLNSLGKLNVSFYECDTSLYTIAIT